MKTLFSFSADKADGSTLDFSCLKDKVVLIVNVASNCGFTPQYNGLEKLYRTYKSQGFEIIAFPCNQFGQQEPGTNEEIVSFCQLNHGVSFSIMSKIDVNGSQEHELYTWLKQEKPGILGSQNIKWNFTKFLINRQGEVIGRYAPVTKPEQLETDIKEALS
ncbi:glutathione peroxidase [Advenella alkanexedens]|uniref:glutathione peroxidase n=1 Tax=Advenella alkanexedens TaxID=1481665 RepID=UPI0026747BA9|nr:glutathione peroxidase [Advenella alkanexedens]WKU18366.1 glutathione peroxidase [Advenella alkanexedens]